MRKYELINADDVTHKIIKRGVKFSSHVFNVIKEVEFTTLGKHFRLILHPHREVLHSKFRAYSIDAYGKEAIVHFGK